MFPYISINVPSNVPSSVIDNYDLIIKGNSGDLSNYYEIWNFYIRGHKSSSQLIVTVFDSDNNPSAELDGTTSVELYKKGETFPIHQNNVDTNSKDPYRSYHRWFQDHQSTMHRTFFSQERHPHPSKYSQRHPRKQDPLCWVHEPMSPRNIHQH